MIDLKKKCWREKVTAEITVAHMLQFAAELGTRMNATEAEAFLNEKGRAQAVWTHMMQAGEEFLKTEPGRQNRDSYFNSRQCALRQLLKVSRVPGAASVSYQ